MVMTRVSNLKAGAAGLVVSGVALALSACGEGGGQEEAKARPNSFKERRGTLKLANKDTASQVGVVAGKRTQGVADALRK